MSRGKGFQPGAGIWGCKVKRQENPRKNVSVNVRQTILIEKRVIIRYTE